MTTRRTFLRILGSTAIIAAAGAGWWVSTRRPDAALAPWAMAGAGDDPRKRALSYALLAPNSHNLQSWLVDLGEPDSVTLYANPEKLLPMTDPFSRQITISLGCFLELFRIAAAEEGLKAEIEPFPEGSDLKQLDKRPVARVRLSSDAEKDSLFAQIMRRRTCKEPFTGERPVSSARLQEVMAAINTPEVATAFTLETAETEALRELCWRGHEIEVTTPRTLQESIDVMRIGKAEIEANPDGIELGGAFLEGLSVFGMLDREQLADPASTAFAQGMQMYRDIIFTSQGFLWMSTAGNDRETQLTTGRAWVRAQLAAAQDGLTLHPLSQVLQEYPEMAELYAKTPEMLGVTGRTVQMLARVGYGPEIDPTPRWPLETKII
ncbi:MAG: twin-arginine translocation pathway signal protein [Rhodobacteraceae bacterium]|nr:twin-arginine translocation pathway signal protein [Paracoccaceae bacterium]